LNILEIATKARQHHNVEDRPLYFKELKAMRENWRIRKINDFVFGDLGYRICKFQSGQFRLWIFLDGPKFAQGELFDIFWEPKPTSSGSKSNSYRKCIQVQVPKNLMRRTTLTVSLVKGLCFMINSIFNPYFQDDPENQDKIFDSAGQSQFVSYSDSSRNIPWESTLKWAQESLINRDILTQVTTSFNTLHSNF
jgi:hypothetical protein